MPSILRTDAYKFSMAEAGAALRQETFYYTHRRGGWHYMPVDPKEFIAWSLPVVLPEDLSYLASKGYAVGGAFQASFAYPSIDVTGISKGSWFYDRMPALSVSGPSAVVSWLEPLVIMLQYRIQAATAILLGTIGTDTLSVTCEREKEILLETFAQVGKTPCEIFVKSEEYYEAVRNRAKKLLEVVGDPERIFEVGMRSVSCVEQHEIALRALKDEGILKTSNVELASALGMKPIGTMGHEHVQRHGSDYAAYIAMRDRYAGTLFYLPDTFNTMRSGVPSALKVIAETPQRKAGIRFDSDHGIREQYVYTIAMAREMGLKPMLALESGWDLARTIEFERLRETLGWPADLQSYGYGGSLVTPDWPTFSRDKVSAVYKISRSGGRATMKFGDEPNGGKSSFPGDPVAVAEYAGGMLSYGVAQKGEYQADYPPQCLASFGGRSKQYVSPATQVLIEECTRHREKVLAEAAARSL